MEKVLTVVFDGEVFRPEVPVDLKPNTSYQITIRDLPTTTTPVSVWDVLDKYTGSIEGPGDWSTEHDHYLYGIARRNDWKKKPAALDGDRLQ